jgi:hypothetical protein
MATRRGNIPDDNDEAKASSPITTDYTIVFHQQSTLQHVEEQAKLRGVNTIRRNRSIDHDTLATTLQTTSCRCASVYSVEGVLQPRQVFPVNIKKKEDI